MDRTSESNSQECPVSIAVGSVSLNGNLWLPETARGVVLFARGSSSSQDGVRHQYIAQMLSQARVATLESDLLTPKEEVSDRQSNHLRFDIGLLATRLIEVTDWLLQNPSTRNLKIGYLSADTASAAALIAAVERSEAVCAIACYSGRPDLAGSALCRVQAPTLLMVGGKDISAIAMNQKALGYLRSDKQLEIVPGATRLFEEPGVSEQATQLASQWFERYLTPVATQCE